MAKKINNYRGRAKSMGGNPNSYGKLINNPANIDYDRMLEAFQKGEEAKSAILNELNEKMIVSPTIVPVSTKKGIADRLSKTPIDNYEKEDNKKK